MLLLIIPSKILVGHTNYDPVLVDNTPWSAWKGLYLTILNMSIISASFVFHVQNWCYIHICMLHVFFSGAESMDFHIVLGTWPLWYTVLIQGAKLSWLTFEEIDIFCQVPKYYRKKTVIYLCVYTWVSMLKTQKWWPTKNCILCIVRRRDLPAFMFYKKKVFQIHDRWGFFITFYWTLGSRNSIHVHNT